MIKTVAYCAIDKPAPAGFFVPKSGIYILKIGIST